MHSSMDAAPQAPTASAAEPLAPAPMVAVALSTQQVDAASEPHEQQQDAIAAVQSLLAAPAQQPLAVQAQQPLTVPAQQLLAVPSQQQQQHIVVPSQQPLAVPAQQPIAILEQQPLAVSPQQPLAVPAQQQILAEKQQLVVSEQQQEAATGVAKDAGSDGRRKRRKSLKNIKYVEDDGSDDEEIVIATEKKRKARQLDYQLRSDSTYPQLDLIVGRRINKRSGQVEYLCKFVGRSYLHIWWLTFTELELFIPEGYQKQHRVQLFDRKLRREGYQDIDDVDDLEANKVTVEKILSHRVDPRDKLDDQIEKRRQELPFAPKYPSVTDYFLLSNADVLPERMTGIVKKLLNENGGEIFEHPVDTEEIPDYLNYILNPMDFGSIAARLSRENYYVGPAAASLFISDVRLVFSNCKEFNAAGSDIWLITDDLSKTFEKWIYEWVLAPSAWLKLQPTADKESDKKLAEEFREEGEDSYDLWSPWEPGCTICRKNDNSEQLLLCDRCDGEIHMYCSTPEMTELPVGEWFCTFCEVRNKFEKRVIEAKETVEKQEDSRPNSDEKESLDEKKTALASPKKAALSAASLIPSILCEPVDVEDKKFNRKAVETSSKLAVKANDRATFFLVKWIGMSVKYSTWERPEDIGDDEQIQRYVKFSRVPTQKEILESTCQLPCCAKRNPYLLNMTAQKSCDKDRFCTLGWRHEGECSRELKTLGKEYGSQEYLKLRMVEQVKAQLCAFHCLLNNHAPDKDVLKQCGVFSNAYVSRKQHLIGPAIGNEEEDEDYSEDENADSSDEEYDDDEIAPFRPMYPGLIEADYGNDTDDSLSKKKPEDEVADALSSIVEHIALGYPTELMAISKAVKYNSKFTPAASFSGIPTFTEFCVALRRTSHGLGLRLGVTDDECASVLGFQTLSNGQIGPAEASRVISSGDVLVAVNNIPVGGLPFKDVIQVIGRSPDLILFHFHSRRPAYSYPAYSVAKQVVLQQDVVSENAATESEYIDYSYKNFRPMLKVGSTPVSSSAMSSVLDSQSNYISPNGPMQHLYAGVIDNSIDPHEHFASFLPAKRKKGNTQDNNPEREKNEFIPYEQSPIYKGGRTLRQYQVEGLNWMITCFKAQRSSILADEMGLGKTVQVVSFIEHLRTEESIRGPYLIVVPLSTIQHWRREIESWTDLNVCVYHDVGDRANKFTAKDMRSIIRDQEWYYPGMGNTIFKFNILLTTFETLLADFEEMEQIHWRLIVVDEAHRLKSSGSRVLKQMRAFRCDRKLLLTGTPLQNNIQELWVLLNYLEPVKFDNMDEFNASFGKLISQEQVEELQKLLGPYILRRVKEDVEKSIPPKEETIIAVELTTLQKQYYRAIYDKNKSFLYRGTKNALPTLNNIQLQLRMCCNHPFLIKGVEDRELEELGSRPSPVDVMNKVVHCSGKMVLVSKLLPKLKSEGHRVLIFSQFLKQLDMLERYCEINGFGYERLDGSTSGSLRQNAIDRFSRPNSKSTVFLLSTKAGGVGINLIAADTVIIFDSDWNPQNDLQAQSRCHRIGQKKTVQIYRLVTRNTYESEMFDRASRKLGLEHAILGTASFSETAQVEKPSSEVLVELLKRGAYALMEEDDTASKEFEDRDIETILKENAHVRVVDKGTADQEDSEGTAVPNHLRKSPAKKRVRKSLGGMSVDRSSFVAEGSTGELAVDDPNFWEKVLPGAVSVEMLIMKLEDGSAISSRQSKIKFISNLDIALTELVNEMKSSNEENTRFGANLSHEYDIAIQILHEVTSKYRKEFSTEQLDLVKSYLNKLEKSRVRSCRVLPSKKEMDDGTPIKKRKQKSAVMYGLDSDDDVPSAAEDDDDEADLTRGPSKKSGKRGKPTRKELAREKAIFSPSRGKAANNKKRKMAPAISEPIPIQFEGGVINDSDDLCTLCGDGGLILLCDGPCHRSFHLECIGMDTEPDDDHWLCPDCAAGHHMCLICKQVGEMGAEFGVIQCSMAKCGRFYHKGCLTKHPRVEWVGKKRFRCPSHFCHGCPADEQKKPTKKAVNVVSCIHCSQAYHPQCMKSTEQFMRLSTNLMICATHLREKKLLTPVKVGAKNSASVSNGSTAKVAEVNGNDDVGEDGHGSSAEADEEVEAESGKRKRVSIPSTKICGFCHKGDVVAETLVVKADDVPPSNGKSRRSSRSSQAKIAAAKQPDPVASSIEGMFVEAPVRLRFQDKSVEMVFVHLNCALHSPEVYVKTDGVFCNLPRALKRGRQLKCSKCKESGATVGCVVEKCRCNYHLRCAIESGGEFIGSPYSLYCKEHAAAKHVEPKTYCVCGSDDPEDKTLSLHCASCSLNFHPKCVNMSGRQAAKKSKENWVCSSCAEIKTSSIKLTKLELVLETPKKTSSHEKKKPAPKVELVLESPKKTSPPGKKRRSPKLELVLESSDEASAQEEKKPARRPSAKADDEGDEEEIAEPPAAKRTRTRLRRVSQDSENASHSVPEPEPAAAASPAPKPKPKRKKAKLTMSKKYSRRSSKKPISSISPHENPVSDSDISSDD